MRVVSLELLDGSHKDYSNFELYLSDLHKMIEQEKWNWKKFYYSEDEIKLRELQLNLKVKILTNNQKNKFNSADPLEWEKGYQRLVESGQRYWKVSEQVSPYVSELYHMYSSTDPKLRHRGWVNLRIAVLTAFGEDAVKSYYNDWNNHLFHGAMEIEDVFRKLVSLNKLDTVVSKFL